MPSESPYRILVIGKIDELKKFSVHDYFDAEFAANYGEATKRFEESTFDYVITDAALPDGKSGVDILNLMGERVLKKGGNCATVCHTTLMCTVGEKTWNIERSLEIVFRSVKFHQGTIESCLAEILRKKCA